MASQRHVNVGGVQVGGGAPVVVQTMTKTETANLQATMDQIRRVADAGADVVRVAVPREKDVDALKTIVVESPIPVIADIHFNHTLALKAIDAGAHCIRLNPGNIGGPDKVKQVADRAKAAGTPMRIGVTSGSPRPGRGGRGRSSRRSGSARSWPTASATRSASRSPPSTPRRRSRSPGRSSRHSSCASAAP